MKPVKYVHPPKLRIDRDAIKAGLEAALSELTVKSLLSSLMHVQSLLAEIDNLLWREGQCRYEFADLLAKARAAFDALESGEPNPLADLRALVELHSGITDDELDEWRDADKLAS